jgi:hypothetical protein
MKQRTLTYWRTNWIGDNAQASTLESIVRASLTSCPAVSSSAIERADGSIIEIRHRRAALGQPIFLHLVSYMPGAEGSVVPNVPNDADFGALSTVPPPNNSNFLGSSLVAMLVGNHCLFCAEGSNISTLRLYFQNIFRRGGRPSRDEQFDFVPVPDREVLQALQAQDVMTIGLDVTLDEYDTNHQIIESDTFSIKQNIIAIFRDFFERDENIRQIRSMDLSNVNAKVSLSIDGRHRGGVSQLEFDEDARTIMNDLEPGFYIKTRNGTRITHNSMKISRIVEIAVQNETIDHASAWLRMEEFHAELIAQGYIRHED